MAKAPRYEDSPADKREDKKLAKKAGMAPAAFEKSGKDAKFDAAGQAALNKKAKKK
jgi:hypothetical protein